MKKASLMISLVLSVVGSAVHAENAETFGDYTIHYNALSTESLSPDIAKTYGIRRSKNRGLVNIAVRHKQEDGSDVPVLASVSGQTRNIHSQITDLNLRQIKEEKAIYYIADFKVDNAEPLKFNISVAPEGAPQRLIEFSQTFFTK